MAAISACRSCGGRRLETVLDLGVTPLADRLTTPGRTGAAEPTAPLVVVFCRDCTLVQITETVAPEILFGEEYPYLSSVSETVLRNAREAADAISCVRTLDETSLVVEVASNDGYLLRNFVQRGVPVLGIDPAPAPALAARRDGVPTLQQFFGRRLATDLARAGTHADVVVANNVLAHVADLGGFIEGVRTLIAQRRGIAVFEVPYVRDLVERAEFDTIYHQHLCYFSATSANRALRSRGLFLNDVERIAIHGGSLRMFAGTRHAPTERLQNILDEERSIGMSRVEPYAALADRAAAVRASLRELLDRLRRQGARVAGYGAAAKATTLLSYCGIDRATLEYVVDRNPSKRGRAMPGTGIPIEAPDRLLEDRPDYVLLLAWNFADEILAQQREYRSAGGRFVVPIPEPCVL